jgi:heptosyltransferase-1
VSKLKILIVKTSSIGDILQSFVVLKSLHNRFSNITVDWVVESSLKDIVCDHPLIANVIEFDFRGKKNLISSFKNLRSKTYDLVFDLQGNCKSGLVTFFSKAKKKIGFGRQTVREFPNIFSTNVRFEISKSQNIQSFYLELLDKYFQDTSHDISTVVEFPINDTQKKLIQPFLDKAFENKKILICPSSRWENKKLSIQTWIEFLNHFDNCYFYLLWGTEDEKKEAELIQKSLKASQVLDRFSLVVLQYFMSQMDLIIGVDSFAIHLANTTNTPIFSVFGPSKAEIYSPNRINQSYIQGSCPYNITFDKTCPHLRTCKTASCIKQIPSQDLINKINKLKLI